jgi:carotenoid cleavage dioxygenase-like enzyme
LAPFSASPRHTVRHAADDRVPYIRYFPKRVRCWALFIPRGADAREGDGWIIQALTNAQTLLAEVNLFEATQIDRGPVATIKVPLRLKPAHHGSWADASLVKPAHYT